MQLKLQRSQRAGGVLGGTVIFCLEARAEYSAVEAANIGKYKLGGQVIYSSQASRKHLQAMDHHLDRTQSGTNTERFKGLARGAASLALAKMQLNISIMSLGRGHHIECKDLPELLEAENVLMEACRELKRFLEAAATFNGSVILVDFDDGEKTHTTQGILELAALPAPGTHTAEPGIMNLGSPPPPDAARFFSDIYQLHPKICQIGASVLAAIATLFLFGSGPGQVLLAVLLVVATVIYTFVT